MPMNVEKHRGFTLIEIVVAVALVAILAAVTIAILDPVKQFAKGRNTQRWANMNEILQAVGQNAADNKGSFSCAAGPIPTTTARMAATAGNYNIAPCLVPVYLPNLPFDPATTSAHYASVADYNTGYTITQSSTTGRISVSAPAAELGQNISVTR
jgi:prepilin-type N-terminal cleavage/methylation domain-containing protein